jgi:hypothetical protein
MSPFKGQGANQAILDSVSLALQLARVRRESKYGYVGSDVELTELTEKTDINREKKRKRGVEGVDPEEITKALCHFELEMMMRSQSKVLKSRSAAAYLHSEAALQKGNVTRAMAAELNSSIVGSIVEVE